MRAIFDATTTMRDGIRLSSNIYLPEVESPGPAILIRTCYNKTNIRYQTMANFFCEHGYVFVINDVRGRGDSDGIWAPWEREFLDGYDTIEWIAQQPWCNNMVGTMGGSYEAWVQWAAATTQPPHLRTMITSGSPGHWFHDWPYRGGALSAADYLEWLNLTSGRTVQLPFQHNLAWIKDYHNLRTIDKALGREMPDWQICLDHTRYDPYWEKLAISGYENIDLTVLHFTGYYDACAAGQLHHFDQMVAQSPAGTKQYLQIGAWNHSNAIHSGKAEDSVLLALKEDASVDMNQVWLAWFNRWLKNQPNELDSWTRVRYYAMGAGGWRDVQDWPPKESLELAFYLHADGSLSPEPPENEGERSYVYDPEDPFCAFSDLSSKLVSLEWTPYQTDSLTKREDVLAYNSLPLTHTLEIAGPVEMHLYASSSAIDTDFVAILTDLHPDGQAVMLSQGILRASFRESISDPKTLIPGKTTLFKIKLSDTAHIFRPGHCIQVLVTCSLFPWFHPNPNSGEPYGSETQRIRALQSLQHGGGSNSRLIVRVCLETRL